MVLAGMEWPCCGSRRSDPGIWTDGGDATMAGTIHWCSKGHKDRPPIQTKRKEAARTRQRLTYSTRNSLVITRGVADDGAEPDAGGAE